MSDGECDGCPHLVCPCFCLPSASTARGDTEVVVVGGEQPAPSQPQAPGQLRRCPFSSSASPASPTSCGDVFLCVGAASSPLRLLLYRQLCAVVEEQRRGRLLRAAAPSYRARGLELLDQPVLLLLDRAAGEPEGGVALPVALRALCGGARDAWEEVLVRPCGSLNQLDEAFLSLSSLPLPPRLVLVDGLPPPASSNLSAPWMPPASFPPSYPPFALSPSVLDWRTAYTALDSSLDCITQATRAMYITTRTHTAARSCAGSPCSHPTRFPCSSRLQVGVVRTASLAWLPQHAGVRAAGHRRQGRRRGAAESSCWA